MINAILAYDDLDYDEDRGGLGDFFKGCADNFKSLIENHNFSLCELDSTQLSEDKLIEECKKKNSQGFLFVAYSHGFEDCLLHEYMDKRYVNIENVSSFKNAFFYTWSCSTGSKLGQALHSLGNVIYFGYTDEIIGIGEGSYTALFVSCANEGIRLFLTGFTVEDSYYGMIDYYKKMISELSKSRDNTFAVAALSRNRRALIHYADGLEQATISDFNV